MLNLMIKNICKNTDEIDNIKITLTNIYKKNKTQFLFGVGVTYLVILIVKEHEKRIKELEHAIEEMKSKGE